MSDTRFDRRLVAPMILGGILNPINSTIIAVSLVPIGRALGEPPSRTAWLVSGLYLATSIGQPVVGKLVDLYGPRRLYVAGSAFVGVAGILGVVAPNLGVLVVARVLLGFGTCAGYPAAMYLIRREAERTGQDSPAGILTALAVSSQTIAVVGPTIGGLLIGIGGWRATFAINIPLAFACLALGLFRLPVHVPSAGRRVRVDVLGMGMFAAMLVSLMLFLMSPDPGHWFLPLVTIGAGAAFAWRERRVEEPFIDLQVLAGNGPLLRTYLRTVLAYTVSYSFIYGFTQWLEDGRGLSASHAGLILLPVFSTAIVVSTTTGRRPEIRAKLVVGSLAQVVACGLLFVLSSGSVVWLLIGLALILGVPQGLLSLANQNAVYHQADAERMGSSAGLLRTFTYLGAMIASAANGAFLGDAADTSGMHHLAAFMLGAAVLLVLVTVADRSLSRVGVHEEPAQP